ncbi:hypothetical protein ID866_8284 [Astraeus odoratus]|nr:hypothetical protein ID866_8284 [Astraeus odoratus]
MQADIIITDHETATALEAVATSSLEQVYGESNLEETWIRLSFSWAGKTYSLALAESDRVYDLKVALLNLTNVPPERQKILGLVKGRLPPDEGKISDLNITPGKNFILIGTPAGDEIKDPSRLESLPDVVNDLDVDFTENPQAAARYKNDPRNIRKIREATAKLQINIIHPLREGKRLLVLDLDYSKQSKTIP